MSFDEYVPMRHRAKAYREKPSSFRERLEQRDDAPSERHWERVAREYETTIITLAKALGDRYVDTIERLTRKCTELENALDEALGSADPPFKSEYAKPNISKENADDERQDSPAPGT